MTTLQFRSEVTAKLIQHAGSDESVVAAARVSTIGPDSERYLKTPADQSQGLISYLMRNRHGTPFEHASMTFLIEAPIFVFREFHRHRIGWSYNELSARYSEVEPIFYVPGERRELFQQGRPSEYRLVQADEESREDFSQVVRNQSEAAYEAYRELIARGFAREVARMVLPVNVFSAMYATCNPRSLMHFLSLRTEADSAKYPSRPLKEISYLATTLESIFGRLFPMTYAAFCDSGRVAP
ncbi:MAG TPA: FAD-dependent thymidylate synthase [Candidatus Paceibacterota bacterium]|nr:FAD-dependent thymidylate synthase [Candidatus Paceibacterota bacterium]